jgi:hypothetical protein
LPGAGTDPAGRNGFALQVSRLSIARFSRGFLSLLFVLRFSAAKLYIVLINLSFSKVALIFEFEGVEFGVLHLEF